MVPCPWVYIVGSTARQDHRVGKSERRISLSISSSRYSSNGLRQMVPPTTWMATSIRPYSARARSTTAQAPAYVSRSAFTVAARPPLRVIADPTSSRISDRSASTRRPPSAAIRRATCSPIPWAAPVTRTTLPANRPGLMKPGSSSRPPRIIALRVVSLLCSACSMMSRRARSRSPCSYASMIRSWSPMTSGWHHWPCGSISCMCPATPSRRYASSRCSFPVKVKGYSWNTALVSVKASASTNRSPSTNGRQASASIR
ncbi:hypothetical protein SDC9_141538 [bioreactor metagenome]|uniref:Uncharacterized protein n=1 Tax=bioreactor metagenome TaxID=1076179 RepID=A0A645E1C3_9ZZZZ